MRFDDMLFSSRYTPVTKELASIHGRLGELLHHSFFVKNPNWAYKRKVVKNQFVTIDDSVPLIEKGILKYVEIPDDLLEQLDFSFIENFKTILRANEFRNIKQKKREPKLEIKLDFFNWVKKDKSSIPFFDYSIWDNDIKKILQYFRKGEK